MHDHTFHWPESVSSIEARILRMVDTILRAQQLGTYNAVDRSRQYEDVSERQMLRQLNEAWSKIRELQKSVADKERQIANLASRLKHCNWVRRSLTSIIVYMAFEGLKALAPIAWAWLQ